MKKRIRPAYEDSINSVDLFDIHRSNESNEMFCVAAAILPSQVDYEWENYVTHQKRMGY